MGGILISYRREDAAAHARWRHDGLAKEFGDDHVSMDVGALEHGANFVEHIQAIVGTADALLVVIGRDWLNAKNADGERRLEDPQDFVRTEIALALNGTAVVIPVLVGGAVMPAEEDLPPDLAPLAHRNSLTLVDKDWVAGVTRLAATLREVVERVPEAASEPPPRAEPASRPRPHLPSWAPPRGLQRWWQRLTQRSESTQRSEGALKPGAGELAERRSLGHAEPARGPSDVPTGDRQDIVDCTVFAPSFAVPGDAVLVQVFAHLVEQAEDARSLAEEFDVRTERRAFKTLEALVLRGASLMFELEIEALTVPDRAQSLVWSGTPAAVQFEVEVPRAARPGAYIGRVTVSLSSVPIGRVKFKLAIAPQGRHGERFSGPVGDDARRYATAFVSYSSRDRQAVLERVQMLKPLGIEYFQDLLDLDPGDRWERKLYLSIGECDLFLLFWSSHAKASHWVRSEAQYALERKGTDDFAPPEIHPVIIEGPPIPRPWPELAHLHFGDRLVYFMTGESRPSA